MAFASWGLDLLIAYAERFTPRAAEIRIDRNVLLFTFLISVATGLVFGSVPALGAAAGIAPALRDGGRTTQNRQSVRSVLIVVQVAASFMLLIGAGLTLRTVINLQRVNPGFKTDNLLTMRIDLNFSKYRGEQVPAFWERLEERLKSEPGVLAAAGERHVPAERAGNVQRTAADRGARDRPERPEAAGELSPGDRGLLLHDRPAAAGRPGVHRPPIAGRENLVVIINKTMARHYWPGEDPVGKRIRGGGERWATIVGVVADTLQQLNEPAHDEVYSPMLQSSLLSTTWLLRTQRRPANHGAAGQERRARDRSRTSRSITSGRWRRCAPRPSRRGG